MPITFMLEAFRAHADREAMMAAGKARQMPVRPGVAVPPGVCRAAELSAMDVDWPAAQAASDCRRNSGRCSARCSCSG